MVVHFTIIPVLDEYAELYAESTSVATFANTADVQPAPQPPSNITHTGHHTNHYSNMLSATNPQDKSQDSEDKEMCGC